MPLTRKRVENIHHVQQFPPRTEELTYPHAMLENKERWLLQYIEIDAWYKTTWNKGGVENE